MTVTELGAEVPPCCDRDDDYSCERRASARESLKLVKNHKQLQITKGQAATRQSAAAPPMVHHPHEARTQLGDGRTQLGGGTSRTFRHLAMPDRAVHARVPSTAASAPHTGAAQMSTRSTTVSVCPSRSGEKRVKHSNTGTGVTCA